MRLGKNILDEKFYIEVWLGKSFVENLGLGEWALPFPPHKQGYPLSTWGGVVLGHGLGGGHAVLTRWSLVCY